MGMLTGRDVAYDHPLVRLSSRQAFLTHFILLRLLSTAYIPSLTPSSILHHVHTVTSSVRRRLLGADERDRDIEAGKKHAHDRKGKTKVIPSQLPLFEDEWMGLEMDADADNEADENEKRLVGRKGWKARAKEDERWWRLWDVSADCKEIGGMECYGRFTDLPRSSNMADE